MICGCSWPIISAMARLSIHFNDSSPLLLRPRRMRSMRPPALFSPSALTRMRRMYSSVPTPIEVCCPTSSCSLVRTVSTCSLETFFSAAMAVPTACTSRAPRCLRIDAASSSPRVRSRIAARCAPVRDSFGSSAIVGYPALHDLRNLFGIFGGHALGQANFLFVRQQRGRTQLRRCAHAIRCHVVVVVDHDRHRRHRPRQRYIVHHHRRRLEQTLEDGTKDEEADDQSDHHAEALLDQVEHAGTLPERCRLRLLVGDGAM